MAARILKTTTGLAGLKVAENPHLKMPEDASYRKHTEKLINIRLKHVLEEPDPVLLEKKINCGQLEEVMIQAENEYRLATSMLEFKPWEPLISEPPPNQWKWPMV